MSNNDIIDNIENSNPEIIEINQKIDRQELIIKFLKFLDITSVILGIISTPLFLMCFRDIYLDAPLSEIFNNISGTIWALAGVLLVYTAFEGQRLEIMHSQKALIYNRIEISNTNKELKGQKDEMIHQNMVLSQQMFENSFFKLIEAFQSAIKNVSFIPRATVNVTLYGEEAINKCLSNFVDVKKSELVKIGEYKIGTKSINAGKNLKNIFISSHAIMKLVEETKDIDKVKYYNIFKAYISEDTANLLKSQNELFPDLPLFNELKIFLS